uniref:ATP synthase complex subunit 8 n=1 Tax=Sinacroneuria dabieshana TaxID=2684676 RepID=A0A6B9PLP0_9NEOP|nr:ATP synthase F0 subunit 8 [Sinacroneuria dabieshana]
MPQMAPISWLALFVIFSLTLFLFNCMNYFCFLTPTPTLKEETKIHSSSMNWKW